MAKAHPHTRTRVAYLQEEAARLAAAMNSLRRVLTAQRNLHADAGGLVVQLNKERISA